MLRRFLIAMAYAAAAHAQPADCEAVPAGPDMALAPRIGLNGRAGVPRGVLGRLPVDLGRVPLMGSTCSPAPLPQPEDVLRGEPAPNGLLQGDGPRDVLHNRWQGRVRVTPAR
jgi:hypothetical protein